MDWLQLILSLVGVIGLIIMLFWALKKLNKRVGVHNGNQMRVLDRINIGREGMLLVVSVCGKLMLLGVTATHIEKIQELDISEEDYFPPSPNGQQQDFKSILAAAFGKKQNNPSEESLKDGEADEDA